MEEIMTEKKSREKTKKNAKGASTGAKSKTNSEQRTNKNQESAKESEEKQNTLHDFGNKVEEFANKTATSLRRVFDKALESRNAVLTIRVDEDSNQKLKILTDSGLFKSRSESAAFLIKEGIARQNALFEKIGTKMEKIEELKKELKNIALEEMENK